MKNNEKRKKIGSVLLILSICFSVINLFILSFLENRGFSIHWGMYGWWTVGSLYFSVSYMNWIEDKEMARFHLKLGCFCLLLGGWSFFHF